MSPEVFLAMVLVLQKRGSHCNPAAVAATHALIVRDERAGRRWGVPGLMGEARRVCGA